MPWIAKQSRWADYRITTGSQQCARGRITRSFRYAIVPLSSLRHVYVGFYISDNPMDKLSTLMLENKRAKANKDEREYFLLAVR